jgi:hypothetical protein
MRNADDGKLISEVWMSGDGHSHNTHLIVGIHAHTMCLSVAENGEMFVQLVTDAKVIREINMRQVTEIVWDDGKR